MSDITAVDTEGGESKNQTERSTIRSIWRERWCDTSWRVLIRWCLVLVSVPWLVFGLHVLGLSPWGFPVFGDFELLLIPTAFMIPVLLIVGAVGVCFRQLQQQALLLIVTALVTALSIVLSTLTTHMARRYAFTALAERSMPLVEVIKAYEKTNDGAPPDLEALVPGYMAAVPETGVGMYPHYFYRRGAYNEDFPWMLGVGTSLGILNFDRFIYFPDEKYPERGWGGTLEPMGRWAYVHE